MSKKYTQGAPFRILLLGFMFLLWHGMSFAQSKYTSPHNVSLYGRGGIHSFVFDLKNSFALKTGGAVGLSYDYYFGRNKRSPRHFGIGTGIELGFLRSSYQKDNLNYSYHTIDTENEAFLFSVYMQNMKETQSTNYIYIPLLFKMRFDIFSMGLGVKAGIPISSEYSRSIQKFKTTGTYTDLYAPLEDIPEHGFVTKENTVQSGVLSMKMDWVLALDVGVSTWVSPLGKKGSFLLYLGLYVEYGLQNLKPKTGEASSALVAYSEDLTSKISYTSVLDGQIFQNDSPQNIINKMHSLCFGIKLGFSFGM